MAQQAIAYPAQPAFTRAARAEEHDPIPVALKKTSDNFDELYAAIVTLTAAAAAAAAREIDRYSIVIPDGNTADVAHFAIQRAGTITRISVVPWEDNATTKTVFTASIAAVAVTHPALEIAIGGLAGGVVSVVPTAANAVVAGSNVRVTTDGAGSSVMPVTVTVEVTPT